MLDLLLPNTASRVIVYLEPINVQSSDKKLAALCRDVLGIEPDADTCFLFVNRRHDTLVMYYPSPSGDEVLLRKLNQGTFLLPASTDPKLPYVVLQPAMLPKLFRM